VDENIIFGAVIDDALGDEVRVTVIAAGLGEGRSPRSGSTASALESGSSSYSISGSSSAAYGGSSASGSSASDGSASADASFGATSSGASAASYAPTEGGAAGSPGAPRHGRSGPDSAEFGRLSGDGFSADPAAVNGNGTSVPGTAAAAYDHGAVLSAPVMDDTAADPAPDPDGETSPVPGGTAAPEAPRPERFPSAAADGSEASAFRPSHAEAAAKTFDVATTRRRPVVFEEDDDLDVPDFLK
jgi:cell division protein FtsZ